MSCSCCGENSGSLVQVTVMNTSSSGSRPAKVYLPRNVPDLRPRLLCTTLQIFRDDKNSALTRAKQRLRRPPTHSPSTRVQMPTLSPTPPSPRRAPCSTSSPPLASRRALRLPFAAGCAGTSGCHEKELLAEEKRRLRHVAHAQIFPLILSELALGGAATHRAGPVPFRGTATP
jgi:hypothetical protein